MQISKLGTKVIQDWSGIVSLPINYTIGLTYRCNARCATCRVYNRESNELTTEEWQKVFQGLGQSPYWVTFTGGEPFLRNDIVELYYLLCEQCQPAMVNIPTNGLLTERIVNAVWEMAKLKPRTILTVNVSLDHFIPGLNDQIRGVPGYYYKASETVSQLQKIGSPNLNIGIHTVISKFNVSDMPTIASELKKKLDNPDMYITEIAEEREELGTWDIGITPAISGYREAVKAIIGGDSFKQRLRREYYGKVVSFFQKQSTGLKCYAGWSSVQITPDGEVWPCCMLAHKIGDLRESKYNFESIWYGMMAENERYRNIPCQCPMANVSYTNMLHSPRTMVKTLLRI